MTSCERRPRRGDCTAGTCSLAQARRMCKDGRIRRLATEFACQWLHIYDFDSLDEKSERHFPTFAELRGAMYEEAILFFTDLFQNDGSVLSVFDADHTFLNEELAKHYGIPGVTGAEWRRVDGVRKYGRGGILAPGGDARQAVGRLAHQPDPARQLGLRSAAGREAAAAAQERAAAAGGRGRDRRADGAAARREAHERPAVRELPRAHRPVRLRAGGLRRDRPPPRARPGRPADRHRIAAARRHDIRGPRRPAALPGDGAARRRAPAVLPQAAGLRAGARRPAFRRAVARGDGANARDRTTIASRRRSKRSSRSRQFREIRGRDASAS